MSEELITLEQARESIAVGMKGLADYLNQALADDLEYEQASALLKNTQAQLAIYTNAVRAGIETLKEQRDSLVRDIEERDFALEQAEEDPYWFADNNPSKFAQRLGHLLEALREDTEGELVEMWYEQEDDQMTDMVSENTSARWREARELVDAIRTGDIGIVLADERNIELLRELLEAMEALRER